MRPLPRLHAVTNDEVLALPDFLDRAAALADATEGVAVHLRAHSTPAARLFELGTDLRACAPFLVVNDRVDVAIAIRADGVQLRGDSLPVERARALMAAESWVGVSVHSVAQAAEAEQNGADYLFAGTIFETPSHPTRSPLGLAGLEQVVAAVDIPVIAIGGIDREHVTAVLEAGAYGAAAIRAWWKL